MTAKLPQPVDVALGLLFEAVFEVAPKASEDTKATLDDSTLNSVSHTRLKNGKVNFARHKEKGTNFFIKTNSNKLLQN